VGRSLFTAVLQICVFAALLAPYLRSLMLDLIYQVLGLYYGLGQAKELLAILLGKL
jgi:uncharacterized membrane protein required for colicin V production